MHGGADATATVVDVSHVVGTNEGATSALSVVRGCVEDVLSVVCTDGGAANAVDVLSVVGMDGSVADVALDGDIDPALNVIDAFFSLNACASFSDPVDMFSLLTAEPDILWDHLFSSHLSSVLISSLALCAVAVPPPRSFDLSKEPHSYSEAMARPDASIWRAAMDREK